MQTNNHQTRDYSAELDKKYGAVGTKEREQFDEEAWNFYTGQLLLDVNADPRNLESLARLLEKLK